MGLRTEMQIDGDRCMSCSSLLALEGTALDRHEVIKDGMAITMVTVVCRNCFSVADIPYWGEILPPEPKSPLGEKHAFLAPFASAPTLER